jgi:peptidoglycan/LPS O-acetylase OafA/YrhL
VVMHPNQICELSHAVSNSAIGRHLAQRLIRREPKMAERDMGNAASDRAELPALTSLRGLAAITVVCYHANFLAFHFAGGGPPMLWRRGYLAVDLFFFLSGFVLTHVYGGQFARQRSWRIFRGFYWARFCRVYPTALFVTAVYSLSYATGSLKFGSDISFQTQLVASLFLMQVPWLNSIELNGVAWSISAELYGYMLFPFVAPFFLRISRFGTVLAGVGLLMVFVTLHMFFTPEHHTSGWGALLRVLLEFTAGILAYRAYQARLWREVWQKDFTLIGITVLIVAADWAGLSDGVIVVLLLALLLASVSNTGRLSTILNAKPLRWLGDISYSVYIFQTIPFMLAVSFAGNLVAIGFGGVWFEVIAVLSAVFAGFLVHKRVDVPARRALRSMPARMAALRIADRVIASPAHIDRPR